MRKDTKMRLDKHHKHTQDFGARIEHQSYLFKKMAVYIWILSDLMFRFFVNFAVQVAIKLTCAMRTMYYADGLIHWYSEYNQLKHHYCGLHSKSSHICTFIFIDTILNWVSIIHVIIGLLWCLGTLRNYQQQINI